VNKNQAYDIIIVGGGLAGLTTALHLCQHDINVLLIEKHAYPHHKVCGEYVSNEVLPYLNSIGVDPVENGAKEISRFEISNQQGNLIETQLPLGGFGMSRYALDLLIYNRLKEKVTVVFDVVEDISYAADEFTVQTHRSGSFTAPVTVGAYGKRSNLDKTLNRSFMSEKSHWLAVKAHYQGDYDNDKVALHNFEGGYCGLSRTETDAVNVCYLTTLESFKSSSSIDEFQQTVMSKNPFLKEFFSNAELLFEKPLTISQIAFAKKKPIEQHIFMLGDSAGLIHPLCGNGMAMAIHSAKIFSELYLEHTSSAEFNRAEFEQAYTTAWDTTFSSRLRTGRQIQKLLLKPWLSSLGFSIGKLFPSLVPQLIKQTHGATL